MACAAAATASAAASREKPSPPVTREVQTQGYRIRLDLTRQVLVLSIPEDREEERLLSTPAGLPRGDFVSASMLVQKAKQFDDGLYAAVELAAQRGAGRFAGKAALLAGLTGNLANRRQGGGTSDEVLGLLLGAGQLGRVPLEMPRNLQPAVEKTVANFLRDESASKPIGFYTWKKDLAAIFQQDRLLQSELTGSVGIRALVEALHANAGLRSAYEDYRSLVSRLTNPNPADKPDLRPLLASRDKGAVEPPAGGVFFFPPSASFETQLMKKLYRDQPIPEGFSLGDLMIHGIRSGEPDLAPTSSSGWYDYKTWAHEPLVVPERMPENPRLLLDMTYRAALLDLFKGAQALTRETHVSQLERHTTTAAMRRSQEEPATINIRPDLSAEPLATFYHRQAEGYRFVRKAVEAAFGSKALRGMRRLTPEGLAQLDLDSELAQMEGLFNGAHETVGRQIGMPPDDPLSSQSHAARFARWAAALQKDPDLVRDARMMVPVFYDAQRRKTKVRVFLGWVAQDLRVEFRVQPAAEVFDANGKPVAIGGDVRLAFIGERHRVVYPATAEVYITKILNRDEFRRHCDKYKTRSRILANLD